MDHLEVSLNFIENAILSIDYSSPKSFIEEIMQKKKNEILIKIEVNDIINKAFEAARQ
ncbi:hypothetical protein [Acinetobacter variabilis]|uniref:hypothetical protein n=1 Tax=Acinetobacter variabilis TaxID=70346 RepID=UPI0035D52235